MPETGGLIVRSINRTELDAFSLLSAGPDRGFAPQEPDDFRAWLTQLWTSQLSAPGRCFVAHRPGHTRLLGGVVFWGPQGGPQHLEHSRVLPGPTSLAVRERLYQGSLQLLGSRGVREVYVLLLAPPLSASKVRRWKGALTRLGFHLRTQGFRYEWRSDKGLAPLSRRLRFLTIEEAGIGAWREVDARVRNGSLDPPDALLIGSVLASTAKWWRLAYDPRGNLVGLVQPGQNDGGAIIEWIGVVPEQRGRGYVHELLACGLAILSAAGADRIRADTHIKNRAMQRALHQAGFDRFGVRWWYEHPPLRPRGLDPNSPGDSP